MELVLNYQGTVKDVKKQFSSAFPYLKLEFFNEPHAIERGSSAKKIIPGSTLLGEITGILREGEITLRPEYTVQLVEQAFQRKFGLPVQVFRRQKDTWIETTKTDNLTLAEQNEIARLASEPSPRTVAERYSTGSSPCILAQPLKISDYEKDIGRF